MSAYELKFKSIDGITVREKRLCNNLEVAAPWRCFYLVGSVIRGSGAIDLEIDQGVIHAIVPETAP